MSQRIRRTTFSSFAGLACFLCCVGLGQSQVPSAGGQYAISGTVRSEENDSPIPQVRVELRTDAGSTVHSFVLTNERGEFNFGQFRPGEYDVIAELEGYYPARVQVDISLHGEFNLVIRLRKVSTSAPAGGRTTAHQLSVPKKAHEAFDKGMVKAGSKADYPGAIQEFQRAIKNYPDYYESYAEMGLVYVRLKDFPSAEEALRKSIELSSTKYGPPLMLLSVLLNDQNRSADAELVAHQAIAAEPNNWRGYYELARALFHQQRVPEAEAAASTARDLRPENPDVYLLLSEIHRSTHNAPALLQDLDTYLKLAPEGPAAPQVRKLREQLVQYMDAQPKP
jgi:tetratricopeptide (TPR) repeat protein